MPTWKAPSIERYVTAAEEAVTEIADFLAIVLDDGLKEKLAGMLDRTAKRLRKNEEPLQ